MALSAIPLMVKILVLMILCLTSGPGWTMAFLIIFALIDHAIHEKKQEERITSATSAPATPAPAPSAPATPATSAPASAPSAPATPAPATPAPAPSAPAPATPASALEHVVDILPNASAPATPAPAPAPATSASASEHVVDILPNASAHGADIRPDAAVLSMDTRVDALNPVADPPAHSVTDAPGDVPADDPASAADVAPTPAVNALADDPASVADIPDLSAHALAPAVDAPVDARAVASALAPAVHVAGKKREKPESSSSSSSLSGTSGTKYDVFLNCRDPDTRYGIRDQLCQKLVEAGFMVFRNDGELPGVVQNRPALEEAIKQSNIFIVILSTNFASSKPCLMELELMWQCRNLYGRPIIPIFHDVSPMDVSHQAGKFGKSFNLHEIDKIDSSIIEAWKEVLQKIGGLRGYVAENIKDTRQWGKLVKRVVAHVAQLLKGYQVVPDKLVGIDLHVQEMMRKLGVTYSEGQAVKVRGKKVRVVKIQGEPGVGKTTLAKVVFNKMRKLFGASSFLEDISLEGVPFSQRLLIDDLHKQKPTLLESSTKEIKELARLFHNVKVLLVLDKVDNDEHIKALIGNPTWFGPGSRIIVTTSKRGVLDAFDDKYVEPYELKPMGHLHALQLFHEHAFEGKSPGDVYNFDSLSKKIVKKIGGLPSDIVRHALSLGDNMNRHTWRRTLKLLGEKAKK